MAPSAIRQLQAAGFGQPRKQARDVVAYMPYMKVDENGKFDSIVYEDDPTTYDKPTDPRKVYIHDVTGEEDQYTLDEHGFQYFRHASQETLFEDDEQITRMYYPEMEEWFKSLVGASRVVATHHVIRRENESWKGNKPVGRVHFDMAIPYAISVVEHFFPEERETLQNGRVLQVNVWRPITQVLRSPLALADGYSIPPEDECPMTTYFSRDSKEGPPPPKDMKYPVKFPVRANEIKYGPGHKWYYKADMMPDDVLVLKRHDTETDGRVTRVGHCAFLDPNAPPDLPPRQSIELRLFAFFHKEH